MKSIVVSMKGAAHFSRMSNTFFHPVVSNGRYLPASEAILMNTRMMQNTLECAIYVGALVKLQNSRKVTTLFHLCHGPDFRSRKTSMILLLSSLREITIRSI